MSPQVQTEPDEKIVDVRESISGLISLLKYGVEPYLTQPAIQEAILARRALEDSRMRLGVAQGYLAGHDPFTVNLTVKEEK